MKVYKETVLALAQAFVGYCEKASNSHLNDFEYNAGSANYTRFAKELDDVHYWNTGSSKKNGYEWCAPFINWDFWMASGKDISKTKQVLCIPENEENLAAGCEYIRSYFRAAGRYDASPEIGDLVIFTTKRGSVSADHIGLLTDIGSDGTIYTIEGNKDNKVTECKYPRDYWKILGYCHPLYDEASDDDATLLKHELERLQEKYDDLCDEYSELAELKETADNRLARLESQIGRIHAIINE